MTSLAFSCQWWWIGISVLEKNEKVLEYWSLSHTWSQCTDLSQLISCLILQVVPTIYTDIKGHTVKSNQVLLESWHIENKNHIFFYHIYRIMFWDLLAFLLHSIPWRSISRIWSTLALILNQEFSSTMTFLRSR